MIPLLFLTYAVQTAWVFCLSCAIWAFILTKTGIFEKSFQVEDFQKTLLDCLRVYRKTRVFFGLRSLFDVFFCVQCLFMQPYLSKQRRINDRQNQNSARLNASSRTFNMCPAESLCFIYNFSSINSGVMLRSNFIFSPHTTPSSCFCSAAPLKCHLIY